VTDRCRPDRVGSNRGRRNTSCPWTGWSRRCRRPEICSRAIGQDDVAHDTPSSARSSHNSSVSIRSWPAVDQQYVPFGACHISSPLW